MGVKLDLGCGRRCLEGYEGVDVSDKVGATHVLDLLDGSPWPWADGTVDEIHCSHFIEHIPMSSVGGQDMLFWFFDQSWRVLREDGMLRLQWPALKSERAFQDPTHRRFIPAATMQYMSRSWRELNGLDHYVVACNFGIEQLGFVPGEHLATNASTMTDESKSSFIARTWEATVDTVAVLRRLP